jgi:hypothetical protein
MLKWLTKEVNKMPLNNLPTVKVFKNDGNLAPEATSLAPRVLIVGTAAKGVSDQVYVVPTTSRAKAEFGSEGTLLRGMWEAKRAGAQEIALYRIGSTSAVLSHVGDTAGTDGYIIETILQDDSAGTDYSLYYDDSADRLVVKRNSDDLIIFDNNPALPIDTFEITVSGRRALAGGPDIGSPSAFVDLSAVSATGTTFVAGTDGIQLSRMELFEQLYVAYKNLLTATFDAIVPMNVFLDDLNAVPSGHFLDTSATVGVLPAVPTGQTYPTPGSYKLGGAGVADIDSLGRVHVEEYEGKYYFWWWFDSGTGTFLSSHIYPTIGDADGAHGIDGTVLSEDDFHEANFGYQLSRFLYEYSTDIVDATGVIGVLPPASNSLTDRSRWLGKSPVWTQNNATGEFYIASSADNGTGLLGNKFMIGRYGYRDGVFGGGFILTDSEWIDGEEVVDDNDIPIDLGKYLSVVGETALLRNSWFSQGYVETIAAAYAGFYLGLAPSSAPTNKRIPGLSIIYDRSLPALDALVGAGYVMLRNKPQGVVVADAPMATMPNSDWQQIATVRIAKAVIDGVRAAVDPFIGEGTGSTVRESMRNAVEKVLLAAKKEGSLQDYKPFQIIQTPSMEVAGRVQITLTLIPAFTIRQIELTINVSKSG